MSSDRFISEFRQFLNLPIAEQLLILPTSTPGVKNVSLEYAPLESFTISTGTTVTWTNIESLEHNVTSGTEFTSPLLGLNETFTYTFNSPGTFTYGCTGPYHGIMTGVVTVN